MAKFLGPFFSKPILSKEVAPDFSLFYELERIFARIPDGAKIRVAIYMWNKDSGLNRKGYRDKWENEPGNPKAVTDTFLDRAKAGDCEIILDNYIFEYHKKTLNYLSEPLGPERLIIDTRTGVNDPEIRRSLYENKELAKTGYMHDKFFLISELNGIGKNVVIQTTANVNITQCHQFNNAIVIYDDSDLYSHYMRHWENLKDNILKRRAGVPLENPNIFRDTSLNVDAQVSAFFFPRKKCPIEEEFGRILNMEDTRAKIDICMAYMTRHKFRNLLKELKKKHKVRILLSQEDQNEEAIQELRDLDVPIRSIRNSMYNKETFVDENGNERIKDNWQARMHHKFVLIEHDGCPIVWTGSYNITHPGLHLNDETVLRIVDKQVYRSYRKMFNMLWYHPIPSEKIKKAFI